MPAHRPHHLSRRSPAHLLEALEPRTLLYAWTAQEVYLSELINRARANPTAEGARLTLDLTAGLNAAEQALLTAHEPLALNESLTAAARLHSADMAARHFFDHTNPDNLLPTNRVVAQGYAGTAGENIGAGYASIDALYADWMATPTERRNLLSLNTSFDATYHYDQLGPGFLLTATGAVYSSYYTVDFGNPSSQARTQWLLGVAFSDTNSNNFYSIGEGAAGIRVDVFAGSTTTGSPVATYTTDAAGNYQLPLASGSYTVLFTRLSDNYSITKSAVITTQNLRLSTKTSELLAPPPPDDFPDAGAWSSAASITINPTTGNGAISGSLQVSADTDLFVFIPSKSGLTTITGSPASAAYSGRIRIYNAALSLIATGASGTPAADSTTTLSLTAGSTYYILFSAANNTSTGTYAITITAPTPPPPPPPPTDDFASSGDWSHAAPITIDATSGSGSRAGSLEAAADSDLFTFTATQSGATTLSAAPSAAGLTARLRIYDSLHNLLATGDPGLDPAASVAILSLTSGQTYFLLIDSADPSQTGAYAAQVQGPSAPPPPPPPPTDDFADQGEWSSAAALDVNPTTGVASRSGSIEVTGDSDLFTFTAPLGGLVTLRAAASGSLHAQLYLYAADHTLLAVGLPGDNGQDSALSYTLTAGATYFVEVNTAAASTGNYTLDIAAPSIPSQSLAATGQPVNTLFLAGRPVVSFVSALGRPIVAIRSPLGQWAAVDLQQSSGSPAISGDLQTWIDPRDGLLYAAARSSVGVILFKRAATGQWTYRNLTREIAVSTNIVSNLTTFTDSGGLRQIAGLNAQGHVVTYWMTGLMWPQGWRYFYTDIATRDLVRRNHAQPAISSPVTSYVTQKNSLNVIGLNADGQVILFFRPGGGLATQLWNWANLSALTSTPALVGSVTASETTGRIVNISGTDASGNLWIITWRGGEGWRSTNATAAASGSLQLVRGSATSWVNSAGAGFVAGLTWAGDIVLFRYTYTSNQNTFSFATVSPAVVNAPQLVGQLRASYLSTGAILLSGLTINGEVTRFTFDGAAWSTENISDLIAP